MKVLFGSFVVGGKQEGELERERKREGGKQEGERERERKREGGKQEGEREREGRRETRGREGRREEGLSCITPHTFLLGASIPIFAHTIHLTTGLSFQRLPLTV